MHTLAIIGSICNNAGICVHAKDCIGCCASMCMCIRIVCSIGISASIGNNASSCIGIPNSNDDIGIGISVVLVLVVVLIVYCIEKYVCPLCPGFVRAFSGWLCPYFVWQPCLRFVRTLSSAQT